MDETCSRYSPKGGCDLTTIEWLNERLNNCVRFAGRKTRAILGLPFTQIREAQYTAAKLGSQIIDLKADLADKDRLIDELTKENIRLRNA